jgi:hypothetical protein
MAVNMNELDLKLKLQSGESVYVDDKVGYIKPLTLREIIKYGYTKYLLKLNVFTLEASQLVGDDSKDLDINAFDIVAIHGGDELREELEKALKLFLGDDAIVDVRKKIIYVGDRVIDRENFDKVREVLKWQNALKKFGEDSTTEEEESESVRRIKEKLKRGRDLVAKAKKEESEDGDIDLADILRAVASKSFSLNKLNIYDLTIFQLYEEFKSLELLDQYELSIKSLMAGAKDVNWKHWSSKIDW